MVKTKATKGASLNYCENYHCAGDCGLPHNQNELMEYEGYPADQDEEMTVGIDCCQHMVPYGSDCFECDDDEL